MAEFYNLEEAARVLGMSPEDLRTKAQRHEIRAFMDAGSWRFKKFDIDEEARRRGMGSDPALSLSDLELSTHGESVSGDEFDLSEFQMGAGSPELVPPSIEMGTGSGERDILLDDRTAPPLPSSSSSTILGMDKGKAKGKQPSDSDVRLVPQNLKGASDSDVRLGAPLPSDSDVTLVSDEVGGSSHEAQPAHVPDDPNATLLQPSAALGGSDDLPTSDSGSDFELTPSSVIDALEPESGSDFELTALDASSDEFETTPLRGPSDSDVTGAEPSSSGINLGRPSDSGINLQAVGNLGGHEDSIELAPLDDEQPAAPPKPAAKPAAPAAKKKDDLSATALPQKVDLSATALPMKADKDIFEDTDFEVDALDSGSDDQTVQLEAASDFDLEDSDSASEVFAIDEEDVDQNAATAMAPAPLEAGEEDAGFGEEEGDVASAWDVDEVAPTPSSASRAVATPVLAPAGPGPEWGGLVVGGLAVATVFMMLLTFVGMDVVRNLYEFHGGGPASGLVKAIAGLGG
jgi:hypothetical protein